MKTKFHPIYQIYIFILLTILIAINTHNISEEEITSTIDSKVITCGSILRIQNVMTKFHLSSNRLTWATGSHLQIITSVKESDNNESLFIIKEGEGLAECETARPIFCDSIIRLEHVATGKNLHSHKFPSFVTDSQEACGFGDDGKGDLNDNFQIVCYNSKEKVLKAKTNFLLRHVDTDKFLYVNINKSLYDDYNCRGCPILGQREVSLTHMKDKQCLWKIVGGMIYSNNNYDGSSVVTEEN